MGKKSRDAAVAADNNKGDDPMDFLDNIGPAVTPSKKERTPTDHYEKKCIRFEIVVMGQILKQFLY